jgi:hypothetical protein
MAVEFIHGGHHWRCDLQIKWDWNRVPPTDYECLSRRPVAGTTTSVAPSTDAAPRVSADGRWEALVQNHNVAVRPTGTAESKAILLTTDGSATNAYQAGSLRWSADSKTLTGYRVSSEIWLSESVSGNVKKLVAKVQWTVPPATR